MGLRTSDEQLAGRHEHAFVLQMHNDIPDDVEHFRCRRRRNQLKSSFVFVVRFMPFPLRDLTKRSVFVIKPHVSDVISTNIIEPSSLLALRFLMTLRSLS